MLIKSESKTLINCRGKLIDLGQPKVMGIINLNGDSFYAGSRKGSDALVLKEVELMLSQGADFIDLGAYSSRPGASDISLDVELQRIEVIESIHKEFPHAIISIDTFRSTVAKQAIEYGASVVNDISGGELDSNMFDTIAELQVPYILMHMKGNPQNMKTLNQYDNLLHDITRYFSAKVNHLSSLGVNDVILDPGFGFAKNIQQNFELLKHFDHFQVLGLPLLAGLSRKSMIYKSLDTTAEHALNGTTALNMLALEKGANILRVHDVAPAKEAIQLFTLYQEGIN